MTIQDVIRFITTATSEDLDAIMDAIEQRLGSLETPGFTARSIRQAIKSARSRSAKVPGKGSAVCAIKQGMKAGRGR